ncbi:MAG: tetratricopeptide repeat-containing sensor histidine kinase [Bacteroidetes bacterium]|nr:tetratricopeptide repeat-containing sensor histidine kinase [Bacteroidota bacterium]
MIRFIVILFFIGIVPVVRAQTQELDSLLNRLRQKPADEERVRLYLEVANEYEQSDLQKTVLYADSGIQLAGKSKAFEKQLPPLYLRKGMALRKQSVNTEALKAFKSGLSLSVAQHDQLNEARFYSELASIAHTNGEIAKALDLDQKSLDIFVALKDTLGITETYNNIGVIHWHKENRSKAMVFYKKAVALNSSARHLITKARLLNNIGLIFKDIDQYDSALTYFNEALSYLDIKKNAFGYALVNNNIGISYREKGNYDLALKHFEIARRLQVQLNDQYGLTLVNDNIGRVLVAQRKFKEGLAYLKTAFEYSLKADNLEWQGHVSEHLADSYELMGDFKNAYLARKQADVYEDSLDTRSRHRELAEVEVKYQVKQQQAENDLLKAENELNLSTIRNKNLLVTGAIIFSVLIFTLLIFAYRALQIKKKTTAIIEEKNARLEALNQEKNNLMGIVAHDLKSPFNSIGGITNILPLAGPLNDEQKKFVSLINNVVESSRTLIQDLLDLSALENREIKIGREPVNVTDLMTGVYAKHTLQAQKKGITLEVSEEAKDAVIVSDHRHIERILDNLISNALKFSQPSTHVAIGSKLESGQVQFYVKDQGPGISAEDQKNLFKKFRKLSAQPTQGESSSGLGLSIVKALVEELGGNIAVESELGKGTTFTCTLPIK